MEPYSIALGFVIGVLTTVGILLYVRWDSRYEGVNVKVKVERKE